MEVEAADQPSGVPRAESAEEALRQQLLAVVQTISEGLVVVNAEGDFVLFNQAARLMLGIGPESRGLAQWLDQRRVFQPDGVTRVPRDKRPLARVFEGGEQVHDVELFICDQQTPDGAWISISASPLRGEDGSPAGAVAVFRDISERKRAEAALRGSRERFRALAETAVDAVVSADSQGKTTYFNQAAESMFGYSSGEVLGQRLTVIMPERLRSDHRAAFERFLATGERSIIGKTVEVAGRRRNGSEFPIELSLSSWEVGGETQFTALMRDITERKEIEGELAQTAAIVEASEDAIMGVSTRGEVTSWNPGAEKLLGYSAREIVGQPVGKLTPEQREGEEVRILEAIRAGKTTVGYETERLRKDGSLAEVSLTVSPVTDAAGTVWGAAAILRDTSEQRAAEQALRRAEQRFRGAFDNAPVGMALVSADGRFLQVNRSLRDITHHSESELLSMTLWDITHPADREADLENVREMLGGERRTHQVEKRYLRADGEVVWGLLGISHIGHSDEQGSDLIVQIEDISERKQAEDRLMYLADHDALTGLYNRGRLELELSRQIDLADRYGIGGAVLLIDLDNLKQVNDTLGHRAGDDLLKEVARVLGQRLRKTDVIGRLGGDEFAVLLPNADRVRAQGVASSLLRAVRDQVTLQDSEPACASVSIGVAVNGEHDEEYQGLLVRADRALYQAKAAGRDRIAVHGQDAVAAD